MNELIGAKLMHFVSGCAYSSFFLTCFEWLTTLNFEFLVMWRSDVDRRIRFVYYVSRYLGLLAQLVNVLVVSFLQFGGFSTQDHCRLWYGFQLGISVILLFAMDYNLIYRLRALYKGAHYVNIALLLLVGIEAVVVLVCGGQAIRTLSFSIHGGCLPTYAPPEVLFLTAAQMLTQTLLLFLTYYKSVKIYFHHGCMKIPLLSLITRDGFGVFVLFMALLVAMLLDVTHRVPGIQKAALCYFIFPIYSGLVSLSSCRIIMNIKTFFHEDDDDRSSSQEGLQDFQVAPAPPANFQWTSDR